VSRLRVHCLSMSLDGFVAGPDQGPEQPLGKGGPGLHEWVFETRAGRAMTGGEGGTEGLDHRMVADGFTGIGATLMGRNMFGPIRGPWTGDWQGWWGPNPPYHHPVFVLTHHPREPLEMDGGTTFHFVTDGLESALEQAFAAAGSQDVRLGGGAATVRACLDKKFVDDLHLAVVPVLLGSGERPFGSLDGYRALPVESEGAVAHVRFTKA
jgi:dihydrofolate reductase